MDGVAAAEVQGYPQLVDTQGSRHGDVVAAQRRPRHGRPLGDHADQSGTAAVHGPGITQFGSADSLPVSTRPSRARSSGRPATVGLTERMHQPDRRRRRYGTGSSRVRLGETFQLLEVLTVEPVHITRPETSPRSGPAHGLHERGDGQTAQSEHPPIVSPTTRS